MADMHFYTNPMSRGRTVRWMLEEVGAPYQTTILNYADSMKSPEYLAINPMGKVPALVHGGKIITETAAICAYLADAFPEAGLAPALDDRADYYRWLFFAAGPMEAAIVDKAMGFAPPENMQAMAGYGHFDLMADALETAVKGKTFLCGDRFTAADLYLGSFLMWTTDFKLLPARQAYLDFIAPLKVREAHLRACEIDDALIPPPPEG